MRADEISWQAVGAAEIQEILDPGVVGRRRAADLQKRIDAFDGFRRIAIQLEIVALFAAAERRQVRFVPDLEEPGSNFLQAIAVHPVLHQLSDQDRPLPVVFGSRDVGVVMKNRLIARGQYCRHEAQLDERFHADGQQEIENLVGVEERIEQGVALTDERSHVVAQDAVEPHMFHAEFVMRLFHLRLPIGP